LFAVFFVEIYLHEERAEQSDADTTGENNGLWKSYMFSTSLDVFFAYVKKKQYLCAQFKTNAI